MMPSIPQIRPVPGLRSDTVVMEAYEQNAFHSEIYHKLKEAEIQAESTTKRYSHGEVMTRLKEIIDEARNRGI